MTAKTFNYFFVIRVSSPIRAVFSSSENISQLTALVSEVMWRIGGSRGRWALLTADEDVSLCEDTREHTHIESRWTRGTEPVVTGSEEAAVWLAIWESDAANSDTGAPSLSHVSQQRRQITRRQQMTKPCHVLHNQQTNNRAEVSFNPLASPSLSAVDIHTAADLQHLANN